MVGRVWRCQDDHGVAGPAHPPLPHRGDRQRVLPVQAQHHGGQDAHQDQGNRPQRRQNCVRDSGAGRTILRCQKQGERSEGRSPLLSGHAGNGLPVVKHSVDGIFHASYTSPMSWEVEHTDEFEEWWNGLTEDQQVSLAASVGLLEERGPNLGFPHSSGVNSSRYGHMRELRTQHDGSPLRTLYAFDPRRTAILLIGGDKTGDGRWYETNVPKADKLYDDHLDQLRKEGLIDD